MVKLLMATNFVTFLFLAIIVHDRNNIQIAKENYRTKYVESKNVSGKCFMDMSKEIEKATSCNNNLWELREWLRECDPICRPKNRPERDIGKI